MLVLLFACANRAPTLPAPPVATCTLLTANDTYQLDGLPDAEGTPAQLGGIPRLRALRQRIEAEAGPVWVLHAGDMVSPSLPTRMLGATPMIDAMNLLDGDAAAFDERMIAVFGNHEFDKSKLEDAGLVADYVARSQFTWLDSSLTWGQGEDGAPLVRGQNLAPNRTFDCNGLRVGVFGVTVAPADPTKRPGYIAGYRDPVELAREQIAALRAGGAEVVVGLTHQTLAADRRLLEALGEDGPDLVVGGHEHAHVRETVGSRTIFKADADAVTTWRITLTRGPEGLRQDAELLRLDASVPPDPVVLASTDASWAATDAKLCPQIRRPLGCLDDVVGRAGVPLVAEELQIRSYETNFGSWVADLARATCPRADVAFVNSGSLRLNRDLPAGPITVRDVETLFAYASPLRLLRIDGTTLQAVIDRSRQEWPTNGNWLQISGFAFAHDPAAGSSTRLTLLGPPPRRVEAKDSILAVVPFFLVDPSKDQDGYRMLTPSMVLEGDAAAEACGAPFAPAELKQLVYAALAPSIEGAPLAPAREGRICSEGSPCLALP